MSLICKNFNINKIIILYIFLYLFRNRNLWAYAHSTPYFQNFARSGAPASREALATRRQDFGFMLFPPPGREFPLRG